MSVIGSRTARVIAVTSGKGGVGKTNVSVNLSVALAKAGQDVMLVDCDVGLANANILLGLETEGSLADLMARRRTLGEVVRQGPAGLKLLPGHSGSSLGGGLAADARATLASALKPQAEDLTHVVVDTGGGMMADQLSLVASSDMILLVLANEPTAFMDAYALVKALHINHGAIAFTVVANRVRSETEGRALFDRFEEVATRFLPIDLDYVGAVPEDPYLRDAVFTKRACVEAFPSAPASSAFGRIARRIAASDLPMMPGGHRFFGLEVGHGAL